MKLMALQLLVQHKTQSPSTNAHSTLTTHTNENKQFWPMYKVMTITKIWKYSVFSEKQFVYLAHLKGYIPPLILR